jgi:hypothetical protein
MPRKPLLIPIVSHSELDAGRQCPFKHQLGYKERWQSPSMGLALSRGILWHQVMEVHYRTMMLIQQGEDRVDLLEFRRNNIATLLGLTGGQQGEDQELIAWMYQGYLDMYGDDEREWGWKILAVEHNSEVYLPHPEGKRSSIKLKIKIDLVVRDSMGRIWIVDHKSGKDLPKQKELDIDDQFSIYTWAMRLLGKDVFGALHNAARTQRNKDQAKHFQPLDERFARTRMPRSDAELLQCAIDAYKTAEMLWRHYRPGEGDAPRAPDSDRCKWRCDFTEVCMLDRKNPGRREQMLMQFGFVQNFERH